MLTCIESDQAQETWFIQSLGEKATALLLSVRSQEAQAQELPCQDYVQVLSDETGSSISFCVCDGVGSSYHGGFAARYLAAHLVEWLHSLTEIPAQPVDIFPWLQQWAREGQGELLQQTLPPDTPSMLRGILEELRDGYGSQTVFLCGRVDYPDTMESVEMSPTGARALFYWMGNVTAHVFTGAGPQYTLGDAYNDTHRWSTKKGAQGAPAARVLTMDKLDRILVYTDGLSAGGAEYSLLDALDTQAYAQDLLTQPTTDDMTVLELRWEASSISEKLTEKARPS
jgi:hypothetical protein